MRNRRVGLVVVVALLMMTFAWRHPTADIRIITHDRGDIAPHRIQAAVDLGLMAVSVLITWTSRRLVTH